MSPLNCSTDVFSTDTSFSIFTEKSFNCFSSALCDKSILFKIVLFDSAINCLSSLNSVDIVAVFNFLSSCSSSVSVCGDCVRLCLAVLVGVFLDVVVGVLLGV